MTDHAKRFAGWVCGGCMVNRRQVWSLRWHEMTDSAACPICERRMPGVFFYENGYPHPRARATEPPNPA
jgi:hypothetical protein